jgi:hypothetical protein
MEASALNFGGLGGLGALGAPKKKKAPANKRRTSARRSTDTQTASKAGFVRPSDDYVRKGDLVRVSFVVVADALNTYNRENKLRSRLNNTGLNVKSFDGSGISQFAADAEVFIDVQVNDSDHAHANDIALIVAGAAEAIGYGVRRNGNSPSASFVYKVPDTPGASSSDTAQIPADILDRYKANTPGGDGSKTDNSFDLWKWLGIPALGLSTGAAVGLGAALFVFIAIKE